MRIELPANERCRASLLLPENGADCLILLPGMEEGEAVWQLMNGAKGHAALCLISSFNWNDDLTPWPAEKVFRGGDGFGGKAPEFLKVLLENILPEAQKHCGNPKVYIAGYSLAGFFALWAAGRSPVFRRAASMSGSLWYPGAVDRLKGSLSETRPERIVLSLGDREEKTRNPKMACIGDETRRLTNALREAGLDASLEMEKGSHFDDPPGRIARGIGRMLAQ